MLQLQIDNDTKDAMRAKDELKTSTLRLLKSAIKYEAINKSVQQLEDVDIIRVIQKQVKQREDSIASFQQAGRVEMAEKEQKEMVILQHYLPQLMNDDELAKLVDQAIQKTGATAKVQMGLVMKEVMAAAAGRADGKKISALVNQKLK